MANEITVQSSLIIKKGNLDYQSRPTSFRADLVTAVPKGPVPGAIEALWDGTDVSFSQLVDPGLCRLGNLGRTDGVVDTNAYYEYGIREPATNTFYPLGEVLPGESFVIRLTRNLLEEYQGTGTGTSAPTNFFHVKSSSDHFSVIALVEAFER